MYSRVNFFQNPFCVLYQCGDSQIIVIILGKHQGQYLLMLLLLFAWPPVRAVCQNHERVVFQSLIGNDPDLVSVALINITYSNHLPPQLFQTFMDLPSGLPPVNTALLCCCNQFLPPNPTGRGA